MIKTNYHTHCCYCDGSSPLRDYVKVALDNNFKALGFTSHSPITDDNGFSIAYKDIEPYRQEVRALQTEFQKDIEILLSFEFDYIPNITRSMDEVARELDFDYIMGSIHLVAGNENVKDASDLWFIDGGDIKKFDAGLEEFFGNDIKKAVKAFYHQTNQMLENEKIDIIGHFDKIRMNNKGRFFTGEESWYKNLINETLELIKAKNVIVEVNTRGLYKNRHTDYYPSTDILKVIKTQKIPVTVSSDAHKPEEIPLMWESCYNNLIELGFHPVGKIGRIESLCG